MQKQMQKQMAEQRGKGKSKRQKKKAKTKAKGKSKGKSRSRSRSKNKSRNKSKSRNTNLPNRKGTTEAGCRRLDNAQGKPRHVPTDCKAVLHGFKTDSKEQAPMRDRALPLQRAYISEEGNGIDGKYLTTTVSWEEKKIEETSVPQKIPWDSRIKSGPTTGKRAYPTVGTNTCRGNESAYPTEKAQRKLDADA